MKLSIPRNDPPLQLFIAAVVTPWLVLAGWSIYVAVTRNESATMCVVNDGTCALAFGTYLLAFFASLTLAVALYAAIFALRTYEQESAAVLISEDCEAERCRKSVSQLYLRTKEENIDFKQPKPWIQADYSLYELDFLCVGRSPILAGFVEVQFAPRRGAKKGKAIAKQVKVGNLPRDGGKHVKLWVHKDFADFSLELLSRLKCNAMDGLPQHGIFEPHRPFLLPKGGVNLDDITTEKPEGGTKPHKQK